MNNEEINTFDEIATMIKKANGYDVLVNKCKQLEKENQELRIDKNVAQILAVRFKNAIDILKKKRVDLKRFFDSKTVEEYNHLLPRKYKLTSYECFTLMEMLNMN